MARGVWKCPSCRVHLGKLDQYQQLRLFRENALFRGRTPDDSAYLIECRYCGYEKRFVGTITHWARPARRPNHYDALEQVTVK